MPEPEAPSEDEKVLPAVKTVDEKALPPTSAEEEKTEKKKPKAKKEPHEVRCDRIFLAVLIGMILGYIAVFLTLVLMRYANFRGSEFDTAIFNQVIWLLARGKGPYSTIRGMNILGDHMYIFLFLLTPIYWLGGQVAALLTVKVVFIACGAIPIYLLAKDKLDSRWIGLGLAGAFLMYPAVQYVTLFDWHPEMLGMVFLLFAFLAIDRKKFVWFYVLCGLAAICKEDMILAVLVLGIIVYFLYDRRAGKWVTGVSFLYFLGAIFFFIPNFAPAGYQYSSRLSLFGKTPLQAAKNFLFHPRRTINLLATRENLGYIFELVMPVAFLCFFAPIYLLPALPAFAINIISNFQPQHTIVFQYTAAIIPFVFIATIFGIKKFKKWSDGAFRAKYLMAGVAVVVILCAISGNFFFGPSPISASFNPASYSTDKHIRAMDTAVAMIPPDASVTATTFFLAKLSSREKIYQFPEPFRWLTDPSYYRSLGEDTQKTTYPNSYRMPDKGRSIAPTYVVLDRGSDFNMKPDEFEKVVARLHTLAGYRTIYTRDGVSVLKR